MRSRYAFNRWSAGPIAAAWAALRGELIVHIATARPLWVPILRGQRG